MNKTLYVAALLSMGLTFHHASSLLSVQTTISPKTSETEPSASNAAGEDRDQGQMSAWMIEASQVAKDYVDGIDKGQYAQSWAKGDPLFQQTISQGEWANALNLSRKNLGKVNSRTLKIQAPAWDPQGLPKGAYMVVEFNTSFEKAPKSVELLTLRRGPDGHWRVLTYQVN